MIIWLDGAFKEEGAHLSTADRGFLLGDGAFETIYVEGGRAAFLPAHLARLKAGLAALRIAPPPMLDEIDVVLSALAAHNDLGRARAAARVTVTRGPGERGLKFGRARKATMLATLSPLAEAQAAPLRLKISSRPRFAAGSTGGFKSLGGYVEHILAHNEAVEAGADEALMLNEHGRLACAAAANLFVLAGEKLTTPPLSEGALPGVVRGVLLDRAREIGLAAEERPVEAREIAASPIFVTNSLIGLRPAVSADAPDAVSPESLPVFKTLQSWYQSRLIRELQSEEKPS